MADNRHKIITRPGIIIILQTKAYSIMTCFHYY
jgi:hypothetical protein